MKYIKVDHYHVSIKLNITTKRLVVEKRQNTNFSKFVKIKGWLKYMAEKGWQIFTKSCCDAFFDRVFPK